jgi:hypothetical protein
VRESMGGIVADHRPPFVVDFDLQLNAELNYLARSCPVVMPDSSVGPYGKCVIGFRQRPDLAAHGLSASDSIRCLAERASYFPYSTFKMLRPETKRQLPRFEN